MIEDSSPHGSAAVELILTGHCQSQRYIQVEKNLQEKLFESITSDSGNSCATDFLKAGQVF